MCEEGDDDIDTILYNIPVMTLLRKSKYFTDKSFKKSSVIIDFTNPNTYFTHTDRVSYLMMVV